MMVRTSLLVLMIALTSACATAPTQPVALQPAFWDSPNQKVAIIMSEIPKPDVYLPGAGCLLCVAVAETNHASISNKVETFDTKELQSLPDELKQRIEKRGVEVVILQEKFSVAGLNTVQSKDNQAPKYDYSPLVKDSGITYLLVVDIQSLGIHRNYSGYVPVGDPQGWFSALGYLVNLRANTYAWYNPVQIFNSSDSAWDESPEFSGLTNAYYQAIAEGKAELTKDF
jgi:hypothetical protein